jgi:hypothetical protein
VFYADISKEEKEEEKNAQNLVYIFFSQKSQKLGPGPLPVKRVPVSTRLASLTLIIYDDLLGTNLLRLEHRVTAATTIQAVHTVSTIQAVHTTTTDFFPRKSGTVDWHRTIEYCSSLTFRRDASLMPNPRVLLCLFFLHPLHRPSRVPPVPGKFLNQLTAFNSSCSNHSCSPRNCQQI